jgi:hypothetical protein
MGKQRTKHKIRFVRREAIAAQRIAGGNRGCRVLPSNISESLLNIVGLANPTLEPAAL